MEGTEGQLCTRLTDGLRRDDTDCFTLLDHLTGSEVTSVTLRTNTMLGFTGEYGTDNNLFDTCCFDRFASSLTDLFAGSDDEVTVVIMDIVYGYTTEDTGGEGCFDVTVLVFDRTCCNTTEGTTVFLIDDDIMRYIDETTSEVTGIGGLQGGICQTLTGTVGRDEVLEHGHTLFKVRDNRVLDVGTCIGRAGFHRLGHNTTDTGELFDLTGITTGTGVHHHVNGVESFVRLRHMLHNDLGQLLIDLFPGINGLTITLIVTDETVDVVEVELIDGRITLGYELLTLLRNDDIIEVEGQTTLEGAVVTEVLDVVEEFRCASHTAGLDDIGDDGLDSALLHEHVLITDLLRHVLVDDDTSRCGLDELTLDTHFDFCVDVGPSFVEGDDRLLFGVEHETFTLRA